MLAKAKNLSNVVKCIQELINNELYWFTEYLPSSEEFEIFENMNEWKKIKDTISQITIR